MNEKADAKQFDVLSLPLFLDEQPGLSPRRHTVIIVIVIVIASRNLIAVASGPYPVRRLTSPNNNAR